MTFLVARLSLSDQRRPRFNIQLDLLCAPHCSGFILHAQSSSWCAQRVSSPCLSRSCYNILCQALCILHSTIDKKFLFNYLSLSTHLPTHSPTPSTTVLLYDVREFSNERTRVERRAAFHKCRDRQMFTEAMSSYLSWITQAGVISNLHSLQLLLDLRRAGLK